MKLNKDFVKRNLEKVKGVRIFGVLLEELSKDELLAVVSWAAQRMRKQHLKEPHSWSGYFKRN